MINPSKRCWELSQSQNGACIEKFASKFVGLRVHADISQEARANIIRRSGQAYCVIADRAGVTPWNTCWSRIMLPARPAMRYRIRGLDAYPAQIVEQFTMSPTY